MLSVSWAVGAFRHNKNKIIFKMEKLDLDNILARISSELDDCVGFWTKFSHDEEAGWVVLSAVRHYLVILSQRFLQLSVL